MDQPHNQFLYKEFAYSYTGCTSGGQGPGACGGHMFKINLYSTGSIDLFKKDVSWGQHVWGGRGPVDPSSLITIFYSTPKALTFEWNPGNMHNINDYLDKITFVPTEHVASFHISKVPISYDILHFIEAILERRKGDVTDADFDVIRYSLQKETDSMELYHRVTHLNKIIIALLYLIAAIVFWIVVYFIMCKIYKKYEELYMEYYNL